MVTRKTGTEGEGAGGEGGETPPSALTDADKQWIGAQIAEAIGKSKPVRATKGGGQGEEGDQPLTLRQIEEAQERVTREAVAMLQDEKAAEDHDAEHQRLRAAQEKDEGEKKPLSLSGAFRSIFGTPGE